jgi:hypothetical protein
MNSFFQSYQFASTPAVVMALDHPSVTDRGKSTDQVQLAILKT